MTGSRQTPKTLCITLTLIRHGLFNGSTPPGIKHPSAFVRTYSSGWKRSRRVKPQTFKRDGVQKRQFLQFSEIQVVDCFIRGELFGQFVDQIVIFSQTIGNIRQRCCRRVPTSRIIPGKSSLVHEPIEVPATESFSKARRSSEINRR
jgi:hypothetical protein